MNFEKNLLTLMLRQFLSLITFLFFLYPFVNYTQHSDCIDALVYDSKREGNISVPTGFGKEKEIFGHDLYNDYFFTEEHNTLWIYLYFRDTTEFEFELTPKNSDDDFDFMLYKIDRPNFCNFIKSNQPIPIRSNLARKNPKTGSITGMRAENSNAYAKAGYQPYFSSTLKVNKGEEYYLIIDSPNGSDAYFNLFSKTEFIDTILIPKNPKTNLKPEVKIANEKEVNSPAKVNVQFSSSDSIHIPFKGLKIEGIRQEDSLVFFNKDSIEFIANKVPQKYVFTITASGYEPQEFIYFITNKKDTSLIFELKKLKLGSVLNFKKINFISNKATILEESYSEIAKLYSFLIANNNMKVEIGGHVNGLGRNRVSYQKLSKKRAKSVYKELIDMGVAKNRLTFKGHGNKLPIYKNPISNEQSSANRRVEITIKELN